MSSPVEHTVRVDSRLARALDASELARRLRAECRGDVLFDRAARYRRLALGLDIGYRRAKVSVDKVNRQPPFTDVEVDYSGLNTRLVLRYMPRRTK